VRLHVSLTAAPDHPASFTGVRKTFMEQLRKHVLAVLIAAGMAMAIVTVGGPTTVRAAEATLESDGMTALKTWWGALVAGTPAALDTVLAPEFQIMRADGSGYDKAGYLASKLPKVAAIPEFSKLTFSGSGKVIVARYYVTVNETRDGKTVTKHAGRLTVFRQEGDNWLVVAHCNFATLEQ
jgi:hypothetical protein